MRRALLIAAVVLWPCSVHAQRPGANIRAAIVPETLSVGDVVHAAIRVRLSPGVRVEFPDTLPTSGDAEGAGARVLRSDTTDGELELTAAYPITAWKPGALRLPTAQIRLLTEGGQDTVNVEFAEAHVLSVLPADTSNIEPRPARDVLGADRVWWPWLAGLLLALALAALGIWMWRRRQRPGAKLVFEPDMPPRQAALAMLDRARSLRLIEAGEYKRFYSLVSEALRMYIEALEPAWSADLTTIELASLLLDRHTEASPALEVLTRADLVKFAKVRPDPDTAHADWNSARTWVEHFGPQQETEEAQSEAVAT
jgi:hypothetical protein